MEQLKRENQGMNEETILTASLLEST